MISELKLTLINYKKTFTKSFFVVNNDVSHTADSQVNPNKTLLNVDKIEKMPVQQKKTKSW